VSEDIKSCCATLYESDFARLLLGDSFHPGGLRLTETLGEKLGLSSELRVLDVASGKGESAIFLARRFGCQVTGIDFGSENIRQATERAAQAGVSHLVQFRQGDAEKMDFKYGSFDAILCECAFCTFPDKPAAAREFARVLRSRGKLALSDLTRCAVLPRELQGLLAWIACIADARPVDDYAAYLTDAGFDSIDIEDHDEALAELVRDIQGKLLGVELMSKLKKLDLAGIDFEQAKALARAATDAVRAHTLGYAAIVGQGAP
jgi:ubiquinone/menaquinone biosynthesis C-methylase UbiE